MTDNKYAWVHNPGPDRPGFRVHVLLDNNQNVLVTFGVPVNHLPMIPPVAWKLGIALYEKCCQADPTGRLQSRRGDISVQVFDGKVLVETRTEVSELTLTPSECRDLVFRLCYYSAKAVGRDLPPNFPIEASL